MTLLDAVRTGQPCPECGHAVANGLVLGRLEFAVNGCRAVKRIARGFVNGEYAEAPVYCGCKALEPRFGVYLAPRP
jgi:hypothetical protein